MLPTDNRTMADEQESVSPRLASRVSLTSRSFEEARERYLDEIKPDPLIRRQIEGWTLQWLDDADQQAQEEKHYSSDNQKPSPLKEDATTIDDDGPVPWNFTHVLSGRLRIQGDYMVVTLHTECWWRQKDGNDDAAAANIPADALWYQCRAAADFLSLDDQQQGTNASSKDHDDDAASASKRTKIHQQMIKRLSADDYISKLLLSNSKYPAHVIEARIRLDQANLEERVQNCQDIAEGIRRAIFSRADTTLDVLELIVNLPCLPTSSGIGKSDSSSNSQLSSVVKLADRAKLRLLEDFMCDACEFEGEDELVSELELGNSDEQQQRQQHKRPKKLPSKIER